MADEGYSWRGFVAWFLAGGGLAALLVGIFKVWGGEWLKRFAGHGYDRRLIDHQTFKARELDKFRSSLQVISDKREQIAELFTSLQLYFGLVQRYTSEIGFGPRDPEQDRVEIQEAAKTYRDRYLALRIYLPSALDQALRKLDGHLFQVVRLKFHLESQGSLMDDEVYLDKESKIDQDMDVELREAFEKIEEDFRILLGSDHRTA